MKEIMMNDASTDKLIDMIEKVALRIDATTTEGFSHLVRKTMILGMVEVGISMFMMSIAVITFLSFLKHKKKFSTEKFDSLELSDEQWFRFVVIGLFTLVFFILFTDGIMKLLEPVGSTISNLLSK
jgi:cytosine/uracil/thiamine/allantoin permease